MQLAADWEVMRVLVNTKPFSERRFHYRRPERASLPVVMSFVMRIHGYLVYMGTSFSSWSESEEIGMAIVLRRAWDQFRYLITCDKKSSISWPSFIQRCQFNRAVTFELHLL